jgi:trigger factor
LALVEGCRHTLEITVPAEQVETETGRIVENIQKRVRLPGFRPGKAPVSLVRSRFANDIRQELLDKVLPEAFRKQVEKEDLKVVGTPNVTEIHFEPGQPLRFTAEFEVAPEIDLKEVRGLAVPYREPVVTDEDVQERLERLREQKAEYVNEDPRPLQDGDYALVSLRSLSGVPGDPIVQDELTLHLGEEDTLPAFTEALRGMSPGDEKQFDVTYPEDFGQERLAGRTVRFDMRVKAVRRKELPEINDEFARDLGDYQTLEELRDAIRKQIYREREFVAQQEAKNRLVEMLVAQHDFPVPEAYIERQIEAQVEHSLRQVAGRGIDPRSLKLDWGKIKESQREKATKEVKASMLLDKVADRESIYATNEEVDREVQRIARQEREPVAATRKRLQDNGTLARIAYHIRTEKTLSFLFEQARKVAAD